MLDNTSNPMPEVSLEDVTREALIPATVTHDTATCPTWDAFLEHSLDGNKSRIAFLQRAVGYALCGETGEPCMVILHGSGVGKTTCLNVITALLDRECTKNTSFETSMACNSEGIPYDIVALKGVIPVTAFEGKLNERLIKRLTGGDKVTARSLYNEFLMPKTNLFLASNHNPEIQRTGNARHGIHLIPFDATISETEKDLSLLDRLLDELPGIRDWAIAGYQKWQKEGLGVSDDVKPETAEHRAEIDILEEFLTDCCVRRKGLRVQSKDLYAAYQSWCYSNDVRQATQSGFSSRLMEIGFSILRCGANGGRVWEGIELLPSADDVLE